MKEKITTIDNDGVGSSDIDIEQPEVSKRERPPIDPESLMKIYIRLRVLCDGPKVRFAGGYVPARKTVLQEVLSEYNNEVSSITKDLESCFDGITLRIMKEAYTNITKSK